MGVRLWYLQDSEARVLFELTTLCAAIAGWPGPYLSWDQVLGCSEWMTVCVEGNAYGLALQLSSVAGAAFRTLWCLVNFDSSWMVVFG